MLRLAFLSLGLFTGPAAAQGAAPGPRFEVSFPAAAHRGPITGRLVLIVSKTEQPEPRFLVSPQGPAIFGVDLDQLAPGRPILVDATSSLGYPMGLGELPAGTYFVQAVINVYEQARRADGHTVWVKLNDGTIEFFTTAAGNLYSDVQKVTIGTAGTVVAVSAKNVIPREERPADTPWIKHVSIQSQKLTAFWGRPIFIHATVLLPQGYDEHPTVRYPAIYALGHNIPFQFRTDSTGVRNLGQLNPVSGTETGYDFYRSWISPGFPGVVAISLEQQTPYFPDSYSVNSVNNGPYGDAVLEEVMPALESRFRLIQAPYGRHVEGASTSGWQSLALMLQHPDVFGGAWVLQPDQIDFRRYQLTNIYEDTSAFTLPSGQFTTLERPFRRTVEGQTVFTMRQLSRFEEVLGTRGRSGYQLGAWEAVFGPIGPDGYPKPLWNKLTGTIDRSVATYMKDHGFDLRDYAERNWATFSPKLAGKLHFFAGDMDDFFLNLAVYQFEDFLKGTTNPRSDADFSYGRPKKGHSWHVSTWADMVRRIAAAAKNGAPAGDTTAGWNY